MVELFADVPPDSPMFEQYSFISADDLPEFRTLLAKIAAGSLAESSDEEKARLLALTFRIVPARHRLGVLDESGRSNMMDGIVAARAEFRRRYAERDDVVDFFDPDRFSPALSIQDNILFGRVAFEQANATGAGDRAVPRGRHGDRHGAGAAAAWARVRSRQRRIAAFLLAAAASDHRPGEIPTARNWTCELAAARLIIPGSGGTATTKRTPAPNSMAARSVRVSKASLSCAANSPRTFCNAITPPGSAPFRASKMI